MHERDLFIAALEIDDQAQRVTYLDATCVGEPALRIRVERLLSHTSEVGNFLEQPAADLCSDVDGELLSDTSEPFPVDGDPPTMLGQSEDTAQTIVLNGRPTGGSSTSAASPSGTTEMIPGFGTLFGRYQVERVLGSGGMGVVYLAEDLRLGRRVALKIPKFDADGTFNLIERFRREARTMASVLHRNLCPIFDVDEQDGTHYLTMAFIDGESLAQVIKHEQSAGSRILPGEPEGGWPRTLAPPPVRGLTPSGSPENGIFTSRQIAELVRKLALALEAAHRAGVIHRDLKPANVMIDRDGEPILMDFGLAWMVHETDARVTQSGAIVGTPAYMSPEQAEGDADKVGAASDIYSLGAMLYELLAGRPVYTGSVTRVLFKLMHEAPTRPSEIRGDVDPTLEAICWKAISRRPEDRFASAADLAEALARFIEGRPWEDSLTRSVSEGERFTGPVIPSCVERSPSLTLRVSEPDRTDVLPTDTSAETIVYQGSGSPGPRSKLPIVLASLLLIGVLGAVWAIVAGRAKPNRDDLVQTKDNKPVAPPLAGQASTTIDISKDSKDELQSRREPKQNSVTVPPDRDVADHDETPMELRLIDGNYEWSEPINLGEVVNSTSSEEHPFVGYAGRALVFVRDNNDIWLSTRAGVDQPFGPPERLPKPVNQGHRNHSPSLSDDGLTLIVSSVQPASKGEADLWMFRRPAIDKPFEGPLDIGADINTPRDDTGACLSSDGLTLWFGTSRTGGLPDLWTATRSRLDEPFRDPKPVSGSVNHPQQYDFFPRPVGDGRVLLFTTTLDRTNHVMLASRPDVQSDFGSPTKLFTGLSLGQIGAVTFADRSTLIFDSMRPGGHGRVDLWMIRRLKKSPLVR